MRFLKWVFTGEVLFSGFLIGYVLTAAFPNLPNFTYMFFILSLIVALRQLIKKPNIPKESLMPIIIYTLICFMFLLPLYRDTDLDKI